MVGRSDGAMKRKTDGGYHERKSGRSHARRRQTGSLAGKPLVFLVTGQDTKHTSMFDWTLPAGFSTGTHVHRVQEETFYVLEGECEWHVGGEKIRAKPGTYVFIPPGVPHNIANASDKPARMIMTVSPPGHEQYFEELVKLVSRRGRRTPPR